VCAIQPNLVVIGQTLRTLLRRSAWKQWPLASRLSRSLKVIGTDTGRSAAYDFILTYRSSHGPISYCFRDKQRFQSKAAHFLITASCIWRQSWRGSPCSWVLTRSLKSRVVGLPDRERNLTISSAIWIQYTSVTDGRILTDAKDRTYVSIASRVKKTVLFDWLGRVYQHFQQN